MSKERVPDAQADRRTGAFQGKPSSSHPGRHETIARLNGDRYRDQVQQINKMQDREIERALAGA